MAILEVQVGASADDGYENEGSGTVDITYTAVANTSSADAVGRLWGGYRFVSAEFPAQGTTIDVAYLKVNVYDTSSDDANLNLHFEELANPAAFTTTNFNITGRDRTEASVSWIADGIGTGWKNSPSLCGVGSPIQEVFDAYSPTTMVVITRPNQDAYKALYVYSWDQAGNVSGAILHLEWEEAPAYYHGLKVQGVGELALCDVESNPLRIRKGGTTYGIELVATDDPNASAVRVKIGAGIKAIRKYT